MILGCIYGCLKKFKAVNLNTNSTAYPVDLINFYINTLSDNYMYIIHKNTVENDNIFIITLLYKILIYRLMAQHLSLI